MPITQLTPMSEIERYTEEQIERLKISILRTFMYIGEACLNKARSTDSYKDQTGNLRSSIGYIITADGRVIKSSDFVHRQIIDTAPINNCRQATIRRYRQTVQALRTSAFL